MKSFAVGAPVSITCLWGRVEIYATKVEPLDKIPCGTYKYDFEALPSNTKWWMHTMEYLLHNLTFHIIYIIVSEIVCLLYV